jgi:hypothetical protein
LTRGDGGSARRLTLAGQNVDYRLFRARRRSIGMLIDQSGLTVRAPPWVTIREIELALAERAEWVVSALVSGRPTAKHCQPIARRRSVALPGPSPTLALFVARRKRIAADLLHLTVLHQIR